MTANKIYIPRLVKFHFDLSKPEYHSTGKKFFGIKIKENPPLKAMDTDARNYLIDFGFEITDENNIYYVCHLPSNWYIDDSDSYWIDYFDQEGNKRISQFDESSYWPAHHFIYIFDYDGL